MGISARQYNAMTLYTRTELLVVHVEITCSWEAGGGGGGAFTERRGERRGLGITRVVQY